MSSAKVIWNNSLNSIKDAVTELSYNNYFIQIKPVAIDNGVLILEAENSTSKQNLTNMYKQRVKEIVNSVNDIELNDIVYIEPSERELYRNIDEDKISADKVDNNYMNDDSFKSLSLNPKYTFDTFVIGGSNHFAHAAALAVAENPAKAYNPLFMYGGVGLGKTHLMHAIAHKIKENNPRANIMYVTSETFLNELVESIRVNKNAQFRAKYRTVDVLLVDDIQFITGKEGMQEEFFHTFNALHSANKQIVLSSDRPPREIQTLEERLRSRFEGGLITDIQPPDFETRTAILRKKTLSEGYVVPNDVLLFIAEKVNSNIRELEGSLTRVVAYANLTKMPVTTSVAELALRDILNGETKRVASIDTIQEMVAEQYGITVNDLKGKRKSRDIAYPRQIAMYLCRSILDCSYPQIGEAFGGRDHTTIMYAQEKITNDMKKDVKLEATIQDLTKRINEK